MRMRCNQLFIQILLMIIITAIVAFTCMNLIQLVDKFCDGAKEIFTHLDIGC